VQHLIMVMLKKKRSSAGDVSSQFAMRGQACCSSPSRSEEGTGRSNLLQLTVTCTTDAGGLGEGDRRKMSHAVRGRGWEARVFAC
jgi:hypothetical protein